MKYKLVRKAYKHYGSDIVNLELDFLTTMHNRVIESSKQDTIQRLEQKIEELSKVVAMLACKLCPEEIFEEYGRYDESLEMLP